ncbi:N-(5'-phosphoribosyl)anthranilate isomerase TrpF [Thermoclostridium stercorarium subsp. stercorarium DSM 8532]|jgi:phosphoribosylanthranilate isomerase|uniref:N-(5'-phosphoribosyl)anthranilate isomerase n=3 Tax=Thermoclostridium stercorarium TaxID=1510 RepID=L7VTT2_THES1|nr:phosphoribosylanthranilate isomerase [Thermoclostridium stercorarium]AGC68988.1 N-(5'-phosphoribosyl)anthranilate isomerase TrpF [Thermoclostridium stercorarium subsp. stercorarium DSM 8532]AGI39967.1 phosphoribosylanthranilate isomerase [Thermoclostridium stercorarium subsp. stercorarium DSM 8532]ANW99287.1 N-(5'-phosphoribosyl)anthranilate isomerase [Thermoclostridium stercorarium subsp. thermolacticum DSM 2910]ANX01916.1 N-(5'-phosphoribosyl)anthranilate isomerase [Thermoclostridium sterc
MTKVKICGLTREQDIDAVNRILPDYIGFVFAKSRRQIDERRAAELKRRLDPRIKAVGVFVNEKMDKIIRLCHKQVIDMVQLHGDENEDYILKLKEFVPNKIIKAVRVRTRADIERAAGVPCDFLLFDAYSEKIYGGTGKTFDWSLIPSVNRPFFLAGGINPENAVHAIKTLNPYCIDVSSGVETGGFKDPKKIIDIVAAVRGCG